MFKNNPRFTTVLTGDSRTFEPACTSDESGKIVIVPGLITCSALIIAYQCQTDRRDKIYVAHLGSGVILGKEAELETIKNNAITIYKSIYWAGSDEMDDGYQADIDAINAILDTRLITHLNAGSVRVDLQDHTVFSTHSSETIHLGLSQQTTPRNSKQ